MVHHDAGPALEHPGDRAAGRAAGATGPYRWLHHPNYVAVVAEGFALPLVHTAWLTAAGFTVANALAADGADPGGELRVGIYDDGLP